LRENGTLTFIGRARNFRLPYQKTPVELIPSWLRDADEIDFGEAMFGYIRKDNTKTPGKEKPYAAEPAHKQTKQGDKRMAYAGRLSFTDAVLAGAYTEPELWLTGRAGAPIVPKLLSTPKPTSFQHYLTQQDPNNRKQLDHFDSPGPHETTLRGHKLYWRRGNVNAADISPDTNAPDTNNGVPKNTTKLYTQIKPVASGVNFQFRIYFENLTSVELGALLWAINLPVPGAYCHALGMAKPLGLGAVRLFTRLHLAQRKTRYETFLKATGTEWAGLPIQQSDSVTTNFCQQFEAAMCAHSHKQTGKKPDVFANIARIKMLLKLMTWSEHVDTSKIRQMSAVQGDNEFRYRPVLPDPLNLDGTDSVATPPRSAQHDPIKLSRVEPAPQSSRPAKPKFEHKPITSNPSPQVTPPPIPTVRDQVDPQAEAIAMQLENRGLAEGDVLDAEVMRITANDYECKLSDPKGTSGKLPRDEKRSLKVGDKVRVRVKRIAFSGAAILTVKGLPKE
jgi:hypothetical protein